MPGFGESDDLSLPHSPEKIASNLADTLEDLISVEDKPIICGFSFGGLISGHLSYELIQRKFRPKKLILVGPGGLGAKRGDMETMIARHSKMSEEEIYNAHQTNLKILMMHNSQKVDNFSVHIQKQNTDAHRIKSRPISATDTLKKILEKQDVPLFVVWGEKDASVGVYLEDRMAILRKVNKNVRFHVEFNIGHWIMYENENIFNKISSGKLRNLFCFFILWFSFDSLIYGGFGSRLEKCLSSFFYFTAKQYVYVIQEQRLYTFS